MLYHKRLVPAVKAKKQITHKITGPEAPLNSKLKNLKEIESLEKISRTTTIENAEIAQIATPIVPAGCSLMISKNQLSGIELGTNALAAKNTKKKVVHIAVQITTAQLAHFLKVLFSGLVLFC